jgi:Fe2+ transport system protein FeoA
MTLNEVPIGESAIIASLLNNEFTLKLVEIGFYENKMLTIEAKSIGSDPICVSLGNSKIMLREKEAKGVVVRRCDNLKTT